jgi:hypothetical protein
VGDAASAGGIQNGVNGNIVGFNPLLGSLQPNGGPTMTQALLAGSPAIDAGDPNVSSPPQFDQRGAGFLRITDGNNDGIARIDIGAVEFTYAVSP